MHNNIVPPEYTNIRTVLQNAINTTRAGVVNDTTTRRGITHTELGLKVSGVLSGATLNATTGKFKQGDTPLDSVTVYDAKSTQRFAQVAASRTDLGTQATVGEIKSRAYFSEVYRSYIDLNHHELKNLAAFSKNITQNLNIEGLQYILNQISQQNLVAQAQTAILQTSDIIPSAGSFIATQLGGGLAPVYSSIANNTAKVPGLFYFDSFAGDNPTRYTDVMRLKQFEINDTPTTMFNAGGSFVPTEAQQVVTFFHNLYDAYYLNVSASFRNKLMLKIPYRTYRQMYSKTLTSQSGQENSAETLFSFVQRQLASMYDIGAYKEIDTYMGNVASNNAFGYAYDPSPSNLQIVMSPVEVKVYSDVHDAFKATYSVATAGIVPLKIYGNGGGIIKITNLSETVL